MYNSVVEIKRSNEKLLEESESINRQLEEIKRKQTTKVNKKELDKLKE